MKVLVTGASGYVGNHTVQALQKAGHEVRGVSRTAPTGGRLYDGVEYIDGVDVGEAGTLKPEYFAGIDAVVHLVGIIRAKPPKQTFQRIHVSGTCNVVTAASAAGVGKFLYLSAIGSTPDAPSEYSKTKAAAEAAVKSSGISFTILRPSIILGRDGEFKQEMEGLVRCAGLPPLWAPVIPIPGSGKSSFQPIYVEDLMSCVTRALEPGCAEGETIELGGSTQVTFDDIVDGFARRLSVRKPKVHAPIPLLMLLAPIMGLLPKPPFTADQLKNLSRDNVCDITRMKAVFGVDPIGFESQMALLYT